MTKALLLISTAALLFGCGSSSAPGQPEGGMGAAGNGGASGSGGSKGSGGTKGTGGSAGSAGAAGSGGSMGSGDGGGKFPAPPALGKTQIDRMGRPGINTALNHSFDAMDTTKNMAKDTYNAASDPTKWGGLMVDATTTTVTQFEANLAILDAVDTVCGNQLLADGTKTDPTRYAPLASTLAGDLLWVDTSQTTCGLYLGVELLALGATTTKDCGGRGLAYDVMNITYNALVVGSPTAPTTPLDGTTAVAAKTNACGGAATCTAPTFPYLGTPL